MSVSRSLGLLMSRLRSESRRETVPMLCIGHSHVACVALAAENSRVPLRAINFWEIQDAIHQDAGGPRFSAAIEQELRQHDGAIFSMIGGAAHGVLGILVHPRPFDFVLPGEPDLPMDPAAEILPARLVRSLLESLTNDYLNLMSALSSLGGDRLFHVEPPPPYADAVRMHADIPWSLYPGMLQKISPASFRYKLWRLHSQIMREWCARAGATFVPCPPQTMDETGFMRPQYYGDGAHANEAYGECVLAQMRRLT